MSVQRLRRINGHANGHDQPTEKRPDTRKRLQGHLYQRKVKPLPPGYKPTYLIGFDVEEYNSRIMQSLNSRIGRPPSYHPGMCWVAYKLRLLGVTLQTVADFIGVDLITLKRWQVEYPEFGQAWEAGGDLADANVAKSLYHRAVGYSHKAVKIFPPTKDRPEPTIVEYIEHFPPDTEAAKFFLSNRQRQLWKQRITEELTGPNGEALTPPPIQINPVQAVQVNVTSGDDDVR